MPLLLSSCIFSFPFVAITFFFPLTAAETPKNNDEITQKIEMYLSSNVQNGFTGSVLVAKGGQILLEKGYGYADMEKGIPNTPKTVFDIGSDTKQFTATAILTLLDQNKLKLTDSLNRFFKSIPEDKRTITIHQLLTHTSGFIEYSGSDFEPITSGSFLEKVFQSPLLFSPGEKYAYSNVGYSFLAMIIEKVSGLSYENYVAEYLFKPAGMTHTGYLLPSWDEQQLALGYRNGYRNMGTTAEHYAKEGVSWNLMGNGGMNSTTEDLYKWYQAVTRKHILSESSLDLLFASHVKRPNRSWDYGYGWAATQTVRKTRAVSHNGSNGVFWASMFWFPDEDVCVIYLSNTDEEKMNEMADIVQKMIFDPGYQPELIPPSPYKVVQQFMKENKVDHIHQLAEVIHKKTGAKLDNRSVLNRLGFWSLERKDFEWAIALLKLNTELFPGDGNLWDSMGDAYIESGDLKLGQEAFEKALELGAGKDCFWCDHSSKMLERLKQP